MIPRPDMTATQRWRVHATDGKPFCNDSVSALAALGVEGPIEGLQYLMAVLSFFTVVFGGLGGDSIEIFLS